MKKWLPLVLLAGVALPQASIAAEGCGEMTIAALNWQSADVLANVDAFILEHGYDCDVSLISGDTVPTITSMVEKEMPDVAPEANLALLPAVAERGIQQGTIVPLGNPLTDGVTEGWYIPKYIADAHPEIKSVSDALEHAELFPSADDPDTGGIFVGPDGWGATVVTRQLAKAFKVEDAGFKLVETGSAAGLDGAISKAYERQTGFITYYWAPTSLLAKYALVRLEGGVPRDDEEWKRCTTVESCGDPKPNYWTPSPVSTLVTRKLADRAGTGPAMEYFKNQTWNSAEVGAVILWMQENQATGEDGAQHFLENNPEIWMKWVPADVAEKIKAAL